MDQMTENLVPVPEDRAGLLALISTALLAARMVSLRGQPLNDGDIFESVETADRLLGEVERRFTQAHA
jgi:hypothetical protein